MAGKAEPALPDEHHREPEAAGPPSLMAISGTAIDTRADWTVQFIEYLTQEIYLMT